MVFDFNLAETAVVGDFNYYRRRAGIIKKDLLNIEKDGFVGAGRQRDQ